MIDHQIQLHAVSEAPSSPRFVSNDRFQGQSADFWLSQARLIDNLKSLKRTVGVNRIRRQIQSVDPVEYTIYLAPDQATEDPTVPGFEQINSIYPTEESNLSQTVFCPPDFCKATHSIQKNDQIPHTVQTHQLPCASYTYSSATQPKSPTYDPTSTVVPNSNAFEYPKLNSCLPLSQNIPLSPNVNSNSSPSCHCPSNTINSPIYTESIPSSTVPTTTTTQQAIVPTIKAAEPTSSEISETLLPPLSTTAINSIVTATTPAPLAETTTSSSNLTLSNLCQNDNKTEKCGVFIKKAILLFDINQSSTSLASIVNVFKNLRDNDDVDFEDLQENDDVKILDGKELIDKEKDIDFHFGNDSTSKKPPSKASKIIDLLEKVYHELRISNQRNSNSCSGNNSFPDGEDESNKDDKNDSIRNSNEQNVRECATGRDLIEACKSLTKTISSYQRP